MSKKIHIIGAGFSGLAAATSLAQIGYEVSLLEKHDSYGGRARQMLIEGFTFDMGPSWYWMPDIFETYFKRFGKTPEDFYNLVQLSPSYQVIYDEGKSIDVPKDFKALKSLFDSLEAGAGKKLEEFMEDAAYKYKVGVSDLIYKPCHSIMEFANYQLVLDTIKMNIFSSMRSHVRKFFKNPQLIQLMEFPVLFLGAKPSNTPALYSLMNYADAKLGTWYPMGGMIQVINAMVKIAKDLGVNLQSNKTVTGFSFEANKITGIKVDQQVIPTDLVVGSADYHHIEMNLLPEKFQQYSKNYWETRTLAPSALIFYLGVNKKVSKLLHHTLFFDQSFESHVEAIYDTKEWPSSPLFYVNSASQTDPQVAPKGCENIIILIPSAPGLKSDEQLREHYYNLVMERIEKVVGEELRKHVVVKKSYAHEEFIQDYNSFKGNAYGLANTIGQTAVFKPKIKSKKIDNLYYTGQMTVPGPGVPPALISGQIIAQEIKKHFPLI